VERYRALSGISGVRAFIAGDEYIIVRFTDGSIYLYDDEKPGSRHVKRMKDLALTGRGLTTYINQRVRGNFARRLR
jgi:hypothetical protein